jgi:RNA polymerase sigma-70 factor, ECF subfamily
LTVDQPFILIKEKCEKVFKYKYQIYDDDVIYDAMTDICLQYHRSKDKIKNFNAWLNGAIHYHFCDYITAYKKSKHIVSIEEETTASIQASHNELDPLLLEELKKEIEKMPDPYKEILTLRIFEGLSHSEIASHLKMNKVTVRKYYSRYSQSLLKLFKIIVTFFLYKGLL